MSREDRLTKVEYDYDGDGNNLTLMAQYRYDAVGRRIEYVDAVRGQTLRYYHDGQNMIAEYEYDAGGQTQTLARTYVHGAQYIDERAVMRDHTEDPVSGDQQMGQDHYYLLKDLYTVSGLVARNGGLEEMYEYDTYGQATIYAWPRGGHCRRSPLCHHRDQPDVADKLADRQGPPATEAVGEPVLRGNSQSKQAERHQNPGLLVFRANNRY